jgi:hypothetical protein
MVPHVRGRGRAWAAVTRLVCGESGLMLIGFFLRQALADRCEAGSRRVGARVRVCVGVFAGGGARASLAFCTAVCRRFLTLRSPLWQPCPLTCRFHFSASRQRVPSLGAVASGRDARACMQQARCRRFSGWLLLASAFAVRWD